MDEGTLEKELAETWAALEIDIEALSFQGETVVGTQAPVSHTVLPMLVGDEPARTQLRIEEVLGEGGMGVVHRAEQLALHRSVAVKMVRPELSSDRQRLQLLREARVTGMLGHPNVIPIHELGRDDQGQPLIVMKRIEGRLWSDLIAATPTLEERASPAYLRRHLEIFKEAARAIELAHTKGILHRDIKPDNVMIGRFGEVYVMDWGIAVSMADDPPKGLPHVCDVNGIEGTPGYLAPEMAAVGELGAPADIYLLGATLHEVLTGRPPHEGEDLRAILGSAFLAQPPELGDHVPGELAAIVRRAMHREPQSRYASVGAFVEAIEEFLLHRGSLALCDEADERFAELRSMGPESKSHDVLFREARFAYERALREWPESTRATSGRRELLTWMARFELEKGAPLVARGLLKLLESPPEALLHEVDAAAREQERRAERLAELEHDVDRDVGRKQRVRRFVLAAAFWGPACFLCGYLTRSGRWPVTHEGFALIGAVFLALSTLSAFFVRHQMSNRLNRRILFTSVVVLGFGAVGWPVMGAMGISMPHATVIGASMTGALWTTVIFHYGPSWIPMSVGHFVVAAFAWWFPTYHFEVFGLSVIPVLVTAWLMAREPRREE